MGPCPPSAREHILRSQPEQYPLSAHEHLPQHHGMAALRHNSFWRASRMLNHHVHICSPRHGAYVCKKFWLDEPNWRGYTVDVPVLSAMVREYVWTSACQLFNARLASWIGGHR